MIAVLLADAYAYCASAAAADAIDGRYASRWLTSHAGPAAAAASPFRAAFTSASPPGKY